MHFVDTAKKSAKAFVLFGLLSAAAHAQAPPPAGFPGKAPTGPAAEIVRFEASPATVKAGAEATLHWEVRNAYTVSIDGVGSVATRGSRAVKPATTTTYTLRVTGTGGAKSATATVTIPGTKAVVATGNGQAGQPVPKLWNGEPDLSGVYLGGRDIKLVEPVSLKPGAESFRVPAREDDLGQGARCLPPGVPGAVLAPYPLQIVQRPDVVVILYEAYNIFRVIPLNRAHGDDVDPTWMGNSVGRFEGDTLVVDVIGFNTETLIAGVKHTEALHVTERYRRTDFGTIAYEAVVEDPAVFAKPVRYAGNLTLHPEWEIGEYICAENNKTYSELLK
ncbi:MAG TPA: hypothetical protein VHH11_11610 [Gammaproteobacteria bacterium]|jgi:hypothetical protein|nr:hypothetical protein [Gammaproteobacteria bacterium]